MRKLYMLLLISVFSCTVEKLPEPIEEIGVKEEFDWNPEDEVVIDLCEFENRGNCGCGN